MTDFILTCSSTTDLNEELLTENGIKFISYNYVIDGKEYKDDFGKTISYDKFYKMIKDGAMPTTSQVNCEQYINFFTPLLEKGVDILHIEFSSGLSGSINQALLAKDILEKRYPNQKLYVVDSLASSSGYGMLMMYLADLKEKGYSIEKCLNWVEDNKLKVHHWFFSTDLTSYKRGGRISSTSFFLGTLLKICPILYLDTAGKIVPCKKIRTKNKAITELVNKMEECADEGINYNGKCYICHSSCYNDALALKYKLEEKFKSLTSKIEIFDIGTVIGTHSGPGTVAVFFMGTKR